MSFVSVVVEGTSDAVVATRILDSCGCEVHSVYGQTGCHFIDENIARYNQAARFAPWFVIRDLDTAECAADLARDLLDAPARWMRFRIAVREIEAWLLADRVAVAGYLGVRVNRVPNDPDALADPKRSLVNLARRSRRRAIREDMVPEPGVTATVGPGYVARISEFAREYWRPNVARTISASLDDCLVRVAELAAYDAAE